MSACRKNTPSEDMLQTLPDHILMAALLENIPDLVYFKDRESRFLAVSWSKALRHGLRPEDMVGRSDDDFFSEKHAQYTRADEQRIIESGESVVEKLERVIWPDGHISWSESHKMPLRDETGETIGTFGVSRDVTDAQEMQRQLENAQRDLIDASRTAGMAEVATGVLHNVGNVLTSLNVSANVVATALHKSKADSLVRVAALLQEHESDLGPFIAQDPKGRRVPEFIASLARHSLETRDELLREIASLQENIDHIKEIVTMQQAYATTVGAAEPLEPVRLMEDALRMNAGALVRHDVAVIRDFQPAPRVLAEKGKVLQILINLIRNAKYAADEGRATGRAVTLRIETSAQGRVRLTVQDNGVGIAPENLKKIFVHGFTTRAEGHGFGLHSSATVAKDLKGTLTVHSDGLGQGAAFTLELPPAPELPVA